MYIYIYIYIYRERKSSPAGVWPIWRPHWASRPWTTRGKTTIVINIFAKQCIGLKIHGAIPQLVTEAMPFRRLRRALLHEARLTTV